MHRRTVHDSYEESSGDEEDGGPFKDSFTSRTSQIDIISLLREQLIRQEQRITELTHQVHVLEREKLISDEHQKNSLKNDRIKYLESSLQTTTNELRVAEKRCVDELELVESLRADLESCHHEISQSKEETARYRQITTDLKTELTHALATVDSARTESQELQSQLRDTELRHREHSNEKLHQYHNGEVHRIALEQQLSDAHTTINAQSITIENELGRHEQLTKEWQSRCADLSHMVQDKEHEVKHWQRMYADLEAVVFAINGDRSSINRHLSSQNSKGKGMNSNVLHFSQPMNICMKYEVEEAQAQTNLWYGEMTRAGDAIDLMATFVQQTISKLAVLDDSPGASNNNVSAELLKAVHAFEQSYRHTIIQSQSNTNTKAYSPISKNKHPSHDSGDTNVSSTHPQSLKSSSVFHRLTVLIAGVCRLVEESIITYQERRALTIELGNTSKSLDTAADMCKFLQEKYRDVKQKWKESCTDIEIRRRVHGELQTQFDDLNQQYQSLQQEHQHQQTLYEQLQKAYQHLQSETKLIETVIVHGTQQTHQNEMIPSRTSGVISERNDYEDERWRDNAGGGSPSKVSTGSNREGMDGSFIGVGFVMNNTRGEIVDASIGIRSHDTKTSSNNNSTSLNDHQEREREKITQMSTTIAHMQNKIASLTDKIDDAVLCIQILAEHGLSLQEQNDELIMQKQLLMNACSQFEDLRDGLVDISSACIMTQPPQLVASSFVNSDTAGSGSSNGAQMTPPIIPPPSRQCGFEYQEAYDPIGLEGFDRTRRTVGRHGRVSHRIWGGCGLDIPRNHRLSFRGVVIYVLAALRMKRLLIRMQQRAYGPTVVRDRIHWSQSPLDGYSMLPSRDYLRSHASNAAIAHVIMTSCSTTKTRQNHAIRMQQTTTAATNHNNKTAVSQEEEGKKKNETNDLSFESKANEDDQHNHSHQHNHDINNNDDAFVSTTRREDHMILPVSNERTSEDRMSLMELICHRHHNRHHTRGNRQGSSREMAVRNVTCSGRHIPGELYGFPPAARVHSAMIHMSRIIKDLRSKEAILQWTEIKYGEQQKDLLLALREAEFVLQDRSGTTSTVATNVHSRNATLQQHQPSRQKQAPLQPQQPQQSQPQSPPTPTPTTSTKPNQSPSPRQRRRLPTVMIPSVSSPQIDHHPRSEQPIPTTEDRIAHDELSTNTNAMPLDNQNHHHHHFPPFSPEQPHDTTDEITHNDQNDFRGIVVDPINTESVDFITSNRPANYYSADEIIARARLRVGGEVQSSHQTCPQISTIATTSEIPSRGNYGTITSERTSSPKRRRPSNEDVPDPKVIAGLYVPSTEPFSLNNSSDFRWWTEQSFDTVYSVDSSTIPPGELIHHHHHHQQQQQQRVERETNHQQHVGIAQIEEVDIEGGGMVTDHSSQISWEDASGGIGGL